MGKEGEGREKQKKKNDTYTYTCTHVPNFSLISLIHIMAYRENKILKSAIYISPSLPPYQS